jgi:hypothetical protein
LREKDSGKHNFISGEPISKLLNRVTPAKVSAQKKAENTG